MRKGCMTCNSSCLWKVSCYHFSGVAPLPTDNDFLVLWFFLAAFLQHCWSFTKRTGSGVWGRCMRWLCDAVCVWLQAAFLSISYSRQCACGSMSPRVTCTIVMTSIVDGSLQVDADHLFCTTGHPGVPPAWLAGGWGWPPGLKKTTVTMRHSLPLSLCISYTHTHTYNMSILYLRTYISCIVMPLNLATASHTTCFRPRSCSVTGVLLDFTVWQPFHIFSCRVRTLVYHDLLPLVFLILVSSCAEKWTCSMWTPQVHTDPSEHWSQLVQSMAGGLKRRSTAINSWLHWNAVEGVRTDIAKLRTYNSINMECWDHFKFSITADAYWSFVRRWTQKVTKVQNLNMFQHLLTSSTIF